MGNAFLFLLVAWLIHRPCSGLCGASVNQAMAQAVADWAPRGVGGGLMDAMDPHRPPNRIPWPPLIVLAVALIAFALTALLPVHAAWLREPLPRLAGGVILASGLGLDLAAVVTMARRGANVLPHRAATVLVTSGPFALSRNPIYLGNTLVLAGFGLAYAAPWFLPAAAVQAWLVTRIAVLREEAHLAARFGAAWTDYARCTPRWLRLPGWR